MDRSTEKEGIIIRVNRFGLAIVEENQSRFHYVFTFDKIRGYMGQYPKEIGIFVGRKVAMSLNGDKIISVTLK